LGSCDFQWEGEAMYGQADPAICSIDHISLSMTDERGTGKITKGSGYYFSFT
jgi:hypothetical protein